MYNRNKVRRLCQNYKVNQTVFGMFVAVGFTKTSSNARPVGVCFAGELEVSTAATFEVCCIHIGDDQLSK